MKEKLKAFAIHLSISTVVIGIFYLLVTLIWYPDPYFQVSGLVDILLILVLIDLILGPLLTFIVFKPNKKSLKFDLSVIAAIQIVALSYGIFTVYKGHPVYVAYSVDRFTLVTVDEVDPQQAKYDAFKVSTFGRPTLVYAKMPENREKRNQIMFDSVQGGRDIEHHAELYEPLDNFTTTIFKRSVAVDKILSHPNSKKQLESFLEQHNQHADQFAFLPLMGKGKVMLWAINKETKEFVDVLDIDPWEISKTI